MKNYFKIGLLVLLFLVVVLSALFVGAFAVFASILASLLAVSILVVPLTWGFALLTNQTYDRICDNSEILYKLNQFGKWSILASLGFLIVWFVHNHFF